jgi:hypothetical protein
VDPDPLLRHEFGGVIARSGQTAPYQLCVEPGPADHLDLVDAGQRCGERVVYGVEPGNVVRGRNLIKVMQAGERVGDTGIARGWLRCHVPVSGAARVPVTLPSGIAQAHGDQCCCGSSVTGTNSCWSGVFSPPDGAQRPQRVEWVTSGPVAVQQQGAVG